MAGGRDQLHHGARQLDDHFALDPTPTLGIGKLLCRLRHQAVAIVVEPVDQRPDRRVLLVFQQGGIVEGSDQMRLAAEQLQQSLVIDVESERPCRRTKIRTVDEQGYLFVRLEEHGECLPGTGRYRPIVILRSAERSVGYACVSECIMRRPSYSEQKN